MKGGRRRRNVRRRKGEAPCWTWEVNENGWWSFEARRVSESATSLDRVDKLKLPSNARYSKPGTTTKCFTDPSAMDPKDCENLW